MHQDLEKLIEMAFADGDLTDKEREIILRKAEKLGEDVDEVEMILEGKMSQLKSSQQQSVNTVKSNKDGELKKCPACGSNISAYSIKCNDCGHEFRDRQANSSVKELFRLLQEAENVPVKEDKRNTFDKLVSGGISGVLFGNKDYDAQKKTLHLQEHYMLIASKKKQIISDFPIPSTKEDILEFLAIAIPKCIQYKDSFWNGLTEEQQEQNDWSPIWRSKCEQIIIKARFLMKDEPNLLSQINSYVQMMNTKR